MGRILAIDYGLKRTGLAATDPLQIIASALPTIATSEFWIFLKTYTRENEVDAIVVGYPTDYAGAPTDATPFVDKLLHDLRTRYPALGVKTIDERNTSKIAQAELLRMGLTKKSRRDKGKIDAISAVLILQDYLAQAH